MISQTTGTDIAPLTRPPTDYDMKRPDDYSVFIRQVSGGSFIVDINPSDNILYVKQRIFDIKNIPIEKQRLIFAGRELQNDVSIGNYGIEEATCIHLVVL